ncbi:MAG: hypothetical protein M1409_01075, partial [Actinobacteria bacterium]|nr:hypothetical protein [Actinomycetota bacterium]
MIRNKKALKKIQRINDCLKYKDDKNNFPIQDIYFWDKFLINWRKYFKLNNNEDIFRYYDLDMVCCSPNIDPKIENVIVIEKTQSYIIYKGGFGSTLKLDFSQPVPYFIDFAVKEITDLDKYEFEDPNDRKRFEKSFAPVDMYGLTLPFSGQIENYRDDFFIMGNISEGREMAWRVLGLQNELLYISLYPEKLRSFAEKVADFDIELGKIQLSNKFVDGIMVYGDIAYKNG